jgi:hypothetical protein
MLITSIHTRIALLQAAEYNGNDVKCAPTATEYTTGFARDAMLIQGASRTFEEFPQSLL